MGLLPMDANILPPSDDRVFKLILTSPESKAGLMRLISAVIGRKVVDVALFPNELGPGDTMEKEENQYAVASRKKLFLRRSAGMGRGCSV